MRAAERIERDAMADVQRALPAGLASSQRIAVADIAGAVCTVVGSHPALALTNRATGLGLDEPATDEVLEAVAAFFGTARHVVEGDVPGLEARGYERGGDSAIFTRGVEPFEPQAGALEIVEVPGGRADEFGALCGEASGTPAFLSEWFAAIVGRENWHCFFAVDGATPVATGALFAGPGGGWFGFSATRAEHRRRGAQNGLLAARIERARELGLTTLVASTTAEGSGGSYRNIERAGFRLAHLSPTRLSPG